MATLQRSKKSFRRQGSSGIVWDDKKLAEEVNQLMRKEGNNEDHRQLRPCYSIGGGEPRDGSMWNVEPPVAYARSLSTPFSIDRHPPRPTAKNGYDGDSGKSQNSQN